MKNKRVVFFLLCIGISVSGHVQATENWPRLTGPWFGQQVPDSVPEIFAPGLVSVEGRYTQTISRCSISA